MAEAIELMNERTLMRLFVSHCYSADYLTIGDQDYNFLLIDTLREESPGSLVEAQDPGFYQIFLKGPGTWDC